MKQEHKVICRLCGSITLESVIDLGWSPLANSYCLQAELNNPVTYYPLHAVMCDQCRMMQLTASPPPAEHFSDYLYFSSYSTTMVEHARRYAADVIKRFGFNTQTQVVEIASNDGYLLQHFKTAGIKVLGIEPASNVAEVARAKHGIQTIDRFFGLELAKELTGQGIRADLLAANNVLAHVPEPNDFVAGMSVLLAPEGVITVEFPDVANLIALGQFDTIYHEHISYLSFAVVERLFARHGLVVFDVEKLPVHGGSLRMYACHAKASHKPSANLEAARNDKNDYHTLAPKAQRIKTDLLSFLIDCKKQGKQVVGYGAPAKGNTLLNFCGIRKDMLSYTVDISPHKQGLYLPGSGIPVMNPDELKRTKPDFIVILPWNLKDEITSTHSYIREWGGKFVIAIPQLEIM